MEKGEEKKRKCRTLKVGVPFRLEGMERRGGRGRRRKIQTSKMCPVSSGRERERWEKVASVDSTRAHTICSLL